MKSTTDLTMIRTPIQVPDTYAEWENLPQEFHDFLDQVDQHRQMMHDNSAPNSFGYNLNYNWDVDSTVPLETLVYYWNRVDQPLPDVTQIVEEIEEALGEADYEAYVKSAYSY